MLRARKVCKARKVSTDDEEDDPTFVPKKRSRRAKRRRRARRCTSDPSTWHCDKVSAHLNRHTHPHNYHYRFTERKRIKKWLPTEKLQLVRVLLKVRPWESDKRTPWGAMAVEIPTRDGMQLQYRVRKWRESGVWDTFCRQASGSGPVDLLDRTEEKACSDTEYPRFIASTPKYDPSIVDRALETPSPSPTSSEDEESPRRRYVIKLPRLRSATKGERQRKPRRRKRKRREPIMSDDEEDVLPRPSKRRRLCCDECGTLVGVSEKLPGGVCVCVACYTNLSVRY